MRISKIVAQSIVMASLATAAALPAQAVAKNYEGIFKGTLAYGNGIPGFGLTGSGSAPFTFDFVFSEPADSGDSNINWAVLPDPVRNVSLTVNGVSQSLHGNFDLFVYKGIIPSTIGPYSYFGIYGFINATSDDFQMSVGQYSTDFGGPQLNRPFSTVGPFDDFLGIADDAQGQVFLASSIDYVSVAGVGDPVPPPAPPIYCTQDDQDYCIYPPSAYSPRLLATPEPGGWMLLIAGFGLVGAALRRARRACIPLGIG